MNLYQCFRTKDVQRFEFVSGILIIVLILWMCGVFHLLTITILIAFTTWFLGGFWRLIYFLLLGFWEQGLFSSFECLNIFFSRKFHCISEVPISDMRGCVHCFWAQCWPRCSNFSKSNGWLLKIFELLWGFYTPTMQKTAFGKASGACLVRSINTCSDVYHNPYFNVLIRHLVKFRWVWSWWRG